MFAVLLQFPDSFKYISGLNTTVTVVFSDRDCVYTGYNCGYLTHDKRVWHIFTVHAHKRQFGSILSKI